MGLQRVGNDLVTEQQQQHFPIQLCGGPSVQWQPTPVFLPGEAHGQRNLMGYSPWGRKESDTTERLSTLEPELEIFQLRQSAAWESLKNIRLVVLVSPLVSLRPYL